MAARTSRLALVVALLLGAAAASAAPAQAGSQIVGGREASIAEVPWQVALVSAARPTDVAGQFCGATIVDASHVVTAAHCVTAEGATVSPGSFTVVAGTSVLAGSDEHPTPEASRQQRAAASIVRMPSYDEQTSTDDIAVVTLATPLALGDTARAIPLGSSRVADGAGVRVSGWGDLNQHDVDGVGATAYPDVLHLNDLAVVGDATCAADYGLSTPLVADRMLCAGGPGEDTCQGDSGGPAVVDGLLVGVTSFGQGCGSSLDRPGVYTELADPSIRAFVRGASAATEQAAPTVPPPGPTPTPTPTATTPAPTTTTTTVVVPTPTPTPVPVPVPVVPPAPVPAPVVALRRPALSLSASGRIGADRLLRVRVRSDLADAVTLRVKRAGAPAQSIVAELEAGEPRTLEVRLTRATYRLLRRGSRLVTVRLATAGRPGEVLATALTRRVRLARR